MSRLAFPRPTLSFTKGRDRVKAAGLESGLRVRCRERRVRGTGASGSLCAPLTQFLSQLAGRGPPAREAGPQAARSPWPGASTDGQAADRTHGSWGSGSFLVDASFLFLIFSSCPAPGKGESSHLPPGSCNGRSRTKKNLSASGL